MHRTICALAALAIWLAAPLAVAEQTNWSAKTPTTYEDGVTPITSAEPITNCTFAILDGIDPATATVLKSVSIPVSKPLGGETITVVLSPTSAIAAKAKAGQVACDTAAGKGVPAVVARTFRGLRLGKPADLAISESVPPSN